MNAPPDCTAVLTLLVVYTERLEACREFYAGVGLSLVREQHGSGPVHYSVTLQTGTIIEFYPGRPDRSTGRLRLALRVADATSADKLPPGEHVLQDPDGRTVVVQVAEDDGPAPVT